MHVVQARREKKRSFFYIGKVRGSARAEPITIRLLPVHSTYPKLNLENITHINILEPCLSAPIDKACPVGLGMKNIYLKNGLV